MKTNIYVDGFNLYYRALKASPFKWLDLHKLCSALFPSAQLNRIRYFTAYVTPRPGDPEQPRRQLTYIRALETIPGFEMHLGQFRSRRKKRPMVTRSGGVGPVVEIHDTEEKGSDVNLATYLLVDGFRGDYEQAVVITNDSDFAEPIKKVRDVLHLPIGVANPDPKTPTHRDLVDSAMFVKRIWRSHLRSSLFPDPITDAKGSVIRKPASW